ncbi:pyridoxal-phosphate dependent enzyme [bacterium]|nr:pyridoxal-phosphate dependent enzyme [bacterium]
MFNKPALFTEFPALANTLPYIHLGIFPTPVIKLSDLGKSLTFQNLYMKCDNISAIQYGGNKIRKLEFLLADALKHHKKSVLTFGAVGSNHALATSLYARKLGIHPIVHLYPQPVSDKVCQTLRHHILNKTEIHQYSDYSNIKNRTRYRILCELFKRGKKPAIIPSGGTTALGACGFVSAAFELKEQIEQDLLPKPDVIFLPLGTMGTAAGLAVGLKAAGLKTKIHAVRVVPDTMANNDTFANLYRQIVQFLNKTDPSFPSVQLENEVYIDNNEYGDGYAEPTESGIQAVELIKDIHEIHLETTYTGKALAALISNTKKLKTKTILFWNTYNSQPAPEEIKKLSICSLPEGLHGYFE